MQLSKTGQTQINCACFLLTSQCPTLLAGAIVDRDNDATFVTIEAERRLGDGFKIELEATVITNVPDQDPLRAFRRDGYLGLTLLAYF